MTTHAHKSRTTWGHRLDFLDTRLTPLERLIDHLPEVECRRARRIERALSETLIGERRWTAHREFEVWRVSAGNFYLRDAFGAEPGNIYAVCGNGSVSLAAQRLVTALCCGGWSRQLVLTPEFPRLDPCTDYSVE